MTGFLTNCSSSFILSGFLGGVDKFEQLPSGGELDHSEEVIGQLTCCPDFYHSEVESRSTRIDD